LVRMLMREGAETKAEDRHGQTAVHWAASTTHPTALEIIKTLQLGNDVHDLYSLASVGKVMAGAKRWNHSRELGVAVDPTGQRWNSISTPNSSTTRLALSRGSFPYAKGGHAKTRAFSKW
jgi:hypothetical protein